MANDLAVKDENEGGITAYLSKDVIKANIESVIGKKEYNNFVTDIVACVNNNPALASCTKTSILSASLVVRSAGLKLTPTFQQVYLIPYDTKKTIITEDGRKITKEVKEAQLQISKRGYVELALKNGYRLNVSDVRRGEMKKYDPINDEYLFESLPVEERTKKDKNGVYEHPIIGYFAFYEKNGIRKGLYMSNDEIDEHGRKYSVSYKSDLKYNNSKSLWKTNFDAMARKTVMKKLLHDYAQLDTTTASIINADMGVIEEDGSVTYVDNNEIEAPREVVNPLADVIDVEAKVVEPTDDLPDFLQG